MKAVEQSAAQWPGVEVMVDFCQTGDSPCPQLGIKAKRRVNTLPSSMFLILWEIKAQRGFACGLVVKSVPAKQETWVQSLGREDPVEKEMAPHCSSLV